MNKYITFRPEDINLLEPLKLSITKNVFDKIRSSSLNSEAVLKVLSSSKTLLLTNSKKADEYEIHTLNGVFFCRPADNRESLLLFGYGANNLIEHNNVLKYGIGFNVSELIVQIRLYNSYNISYDIVNGNIVQKDAYQGVSSQSAVQTIYHEMSRIKKTDEGTGASDDNEEPIYKPDRKLSNLLTLAENYAILSSELEKNTVNSIGKVSYKSIKAVQYNRVDRIAYDLITDSIDESHIKVGVQIDIEDKFDNRHTAEIITIIKKRGSYTLTVLFSEHIDIALLNSTGWFTLSFSTVNRDVQLGANEKIKSGEAAAKYMDNILGLNQPSGFTSKNLSKLKASLNSKKYPPNKSQVDAIVSGIETNDVFLVMGPPGTGKTTVILEWVKYFVLEEKKRVLVSSQNNKAVDNVLARIAEEKDIDVIRIGSEAKVQSDVAPYLFENKINSKRQEIISVTQENLDSINEICTKWNVYYNHLCQLFSEAANVDGKKKIFKAFVSQRVKPIYNKMKSLVEADRSYKQQKRLLHASIMEIYNEIEAARNSKNLITKLLGKMRYRKQASKLSDVITEYENLCMQEELLVQEYNNDMQSFTTLMRQAYLQPFSDYYLAYTVWTRNCNETIDSVPNLPNMWRLFSDIHIDSRTLSVYGNFRKLLEDVNLELNNAGKIKTTIGDWQTNVKDQQNYALNELILDSVNLVGATCIGINSQKRFSDLSFDVTIIDEAGQIQIHNALVPMSVSNKLIMLGDHKQIPPSADPELLDACIQNGISTELLEKSLFEKMYDSLPETNKTMLDTQYRMPAEIANTISEWFYEKKYFSPEFKRNLPSFLPQLSPKPFVIIDTSMEKNRFETKIPDAGSNNQLEASIVYKIIDNIIRSGTEVDLKEIGVISAYKSQVKLIISLLTKIIDKSQVDEMVATLDSFQGQERDIIIYSFTKSSNIPAKCKRIGFLNELRRLNVAMTRCKKMLILIGDMRFLSSCENVDLDSMQQPIYDKSEKQFSDFIRKMLIDVVSGNGDVIKYADFTAKMHV